MTDKGEKEFFYMFEKVLTKKETSTKRNKPVLLSDGIAVSICELSTAQDTSETGCSTKKSSTSFSFAKSSKSAPYQWSIHLIYEFFYLYPYFL